MGVNGIYGLSGSGLDIESLVKMGMSGKNKQYDKMEQQEIANTWLKEAYNDVYNDLTVYKYDTLSTYKMQSNLNAMQATSSNSSVVTATANGAAAAMNHTVEVTSVASNAYLQTTQHEVDGKMVDYGVTRANQDAKTSNKLVDVIFESYKELDSSDDGVGNYIVNGKEVSGSDVAISLKLKDTTGKDAKEYTLTYTYDELFQGEKTLNDFASAIARTGANIQGGYDTANDSFSLYNKTSGENHIIDISVGSESSNAKANTITLLNNLNLGIYDAPTGKMSDRIEFDDSIKKTIMETSSVSGSALSVNLKDILGLTATVKDNTITVKDSTGATLKSFTKDGGSIAGIDDVAFSLKVSNDDTTETISFFYAELFDFDGVEEGRESLTGVAGLKNLVNKINDANLGIQAAYDSDKDSFSLTNSAGKVDIQAADGTGKSVAAQLIKSLNLVKDSSVSEPTTSYATSADGIKRVNEHTAYDKLADALGISLGSHALTEDALKLKVGGNGTETDVILKYGDLFDNTGNSTGDLSTLATKIESAISAYNTANPTAPINVKANYDEATGKFTLTNASGDVTLTGVDALGKALASDLGLAENAETAAAKKHSYTGTNAKVTIDGKEYDNDTNKLTVAGVTYNFLDSTAGSKATISVSQDTDKIVDYMKSFVEDYNKLLDSLNEKLSEQKYSDYKPLSKRQEEEMTEKQIEKWNEKAKSGLLYHNSEIQELVSAMREAIYTKVDAVDSEYNTLSSIGITTTNTKGHLTIDTDKLKKALADDPDCVYQLFASDQDSTYIAGTTNKNKITTAQSKMDYSNTGVANRLYNVMTNHMSKISDIAGTSKETDDQSYLGKLITNMQTKMSNFKTMMTAYENKLYKRYDAMEVALSRLNMQLGYISGSFS